MAIYLIDLFYALGHERGLRLQVKSLRFQAVSKWGIKFMKVIFLQSSLLCSFLLSAISLAQPQSVRWTGKEDKNSNLVHVLDVIRTKTAIELSPSNFMLVESRKLATSQYMMLAQTAAGIPIRGLSLRIWTSLENSETIQIEAQIDVSPNTARWSAKTAKALLSSFDTTELVRMAIKNTDDPFLRKITWQDMWENGELVRVVKIKAKRGKHVVEIGRAHV